ncbi:MAG: CaiB/BaiF CoA transferase family protein, partial [Myxococcota bacterium]
SEFFREARSDLPGPLAGVRVVELTTTWAGPMAGCILADYGADVIKVEHPAGEVARRSPPFLPGTKPPLSFMQTTLNRNKRSLSLDLHPPRGREIFLDLCGRADLVIENFRPGALDGWGVGFKELRARKHDIILVSISGFGQYGRDHDRAGYDPLAQAASGFLSLNGSPEGEPVKAPTFLGDDLSGLHAALAAMAALRHRDRTGEGQHVDVALLDSVLFQSTGYLTLGAMDVALPRLGNQFRIAAPANVYACRDGRAMVGVLVDAHWKRLARVIGRPELADDPGYATTAARIARRGQVDALLGDWLAQRSVAEAEALLLAEGLPIAPVRTYAEAARDPHVADREMLQATTVEGNARIPVVGPAAKFSRTPVRVRSGAPALGANNDEILAELGIDAGERAELKQSGVI